MRFATNVNLFGNGVDEISVVIKNIPLSDILVMGADKSSIKISYNGVDYVKFKDTDFIAEVLSNRKKRINIYGRFNLNSWNGQQSLQLFISDYEFVEDISKYDF